MQYAFQFEEEIKGRFVVNIWFEQFSMMMENFLFVFFSSLHAISLHLHSSFWIPYNRNMLKDKKYHKKTRVKMSQNWKTHRDSSSFWKMVITPNHERVNLLACVASIKKKKKKEELWNGIKIIPIKRTQREKFHFILIQPNIEHWKRKVFYSLICKHTHTHTFNGGNKVGQKKWKN